MYLSLTDGGVADSLGVLVSLLLPQSESHGGRKAVNQAAGQNGRCMANYNYVLISYSHTLQIEN